jgi:hypothetical protein
VFRKNAYPAAVHPASDALLFTRTQSNWTHGRDHDIVKLSFSGNSLYVSDEVTVLQNYNAWRRTFAGEIADTSKTWPVYCAVVLHSDRQPTSAICAVQLHSTRVLQQRDSTSNGPFKPRTHKVLQHEIAAEFIPDQNQASGDDLDPES